MEQLGSLWADIHEISYLGIFRPSVEKIQVSLNSNKHNGTVHADRYIFLITSRLVLLRIRNIADKMCRENQNTHFVFKNVFRKSSRLWDNVEYIVQPDRTNMIGRMLQMAIWRMRIACWIPKAKNTHSQYVTIIAFPLQIGCKNAPQCYVIVDCLYCCNRDGECLLCGMDWLLCGTDCSIIIFIYCNWVVTRWQWLFYM